MEVVELRRYCRDPYSKKDMSRTAFDFTVHVNSSFCTIHAETETAAQSLLENAESEEFIYDGLLPVEHRYIEEVCRCLLESGFSIQKDGLCMVKNHDGDLVLE